MPLHDTQMQLLRVGMERGIDSTQPVADQLRRRVYAM